MVELTGYLDRRGRLSDLLDVVDRDRLGLLDSFHESWLTSLFAAEGGIGPAATQAVRNAGSSLATTCRAAVLAPRVVFV